MNVVGKVGSLISQGVYSVATPFHPFGGAVDVIVVQQQDGSFRSTPWYVRFGKFQGVLKGAEKVVRISVNGVEADFHMFLDNSGEAYFVREADSEINGEVRESRDTVESKVEIPRLDHSVSDSGVAQLRDECGSSDMSRIERAESDIDRRFYDFQDCSSLDGTEYGSNRYESLDGEQYGEPQGSDSEVILVSVDGHILTAPISASEQNAENLELDTPRFHLGPGEGPDLCEGNEDFGLDEDVWAADYINKLSAPAGCKTDDNARSIKNNEDSVVQEVETCEEEVNNISQVQETQNKLNQYINVHEHSNSGDISVGFSKEDVFKSCLELTDLAKETDNTVSEEIDCASRSQLVSEKSLQNDVQLKKTEDREAIESKTHTLTTPSGTLSERENTSSHLELESKKSQNKSPQTQAAADQIEGEDSVQLEDNKVTSLPSSSVEHSNITVSPAKVDLTAVEQMSSDCILMRSGQEAEVEQDERTADDKEVGSSLGTTLIDEKCSNMNSHVTTFSEGIQTDTNTTVEVSLCGNELHAGMGLAAATEVFDAHRVLLEDFRSSAASIVKNNNLIVRYRERYLTWEKAAHILLGMTAFGLDLPVEPEDAIPVEQENTTIAHDDVSKARDDSSGRRWRLWPIPFRRVKTIEHTNSNSSSEETFVDSEPSLQDAQVDLATTSGGGRTSPHRQFIRTNVPTSEQIASLKLQEGQNMVTFSFSTRVLGTQQVDAHIYLWKWNAKIVISDVDGTITKSDVLGQFMPLVGKDWTQSGVAKLFSAIKENGYQLLFLSARAIVQAYLTRSFLLNLKQDGKTLPNGPVVISPDGLFPSLYREVIRRAPHEFKIACLEDIKNLFPSDHNPFYAGFGNRDTDELSYLKIGIPKGKIFIINPKGEVAISHRIDVKSYTNLHTLVDDMFPSTSLVEQEDFNSWNYWRTPLPDID